MPFFLPRYSSGTALPMSTMAVSRKTMRKGQLSPTLSGGGLAFGAFPIALPCSSGPQRFEHWTDIFCASTHCSICCRRKCSKTNKRKFAAFLLWRCHPSCYLNKHFSNNPLQWALLKVFGLPDASLSPRYASQRKVKSRRFSGSPMHR